MSQMYKQCIHECVMPIRNAHIPEHYIGPISIICYCLGVLDKSCQRLSSRAFTNVASPAVRRRRRVHHRLCRHISLVTDEQESPYFPRLHVRCKVLRRTFNDHKRK